MSTQSELISCGGLHVLLSLLSGASGHSSAVDEELSKAITFVLQCCLPQQQQQQRQEDASNGKIRWSVGKVGKIGKVSNVGKLRWSVGKVGKIGKVGNVVKVSN